MHFLFFEQLKNNHKDEHEEIKKIVASSNFSIPACIATALTTTVVGYVHAADTQILLWYFTVIMLDCTGT
jgi:hypothetical protein